MPPMNVASNTPVSTSGGSDLTTFSPGLIGPGQTGSGGSGTGSGSGCPPFDATCRTECAKLDSNGCIVCKCGKTKIVIHEVHL